MKAFFWIILSVSLILNAFLLFFQPKPHVDTVKPVQNELNTITLKGLLPGIVTNTVMVEYTPQQAVDELNRYRTNSFVVTITNYRARVSLMDRWIEFDIPKRKEIDNLIKASAYLSGTYSAGYWRRIVSVFDCPVYLGGELAYRKESGLDAGVSLMVGF